MSLFPGLNGATFSDCRRWRFRLWRTWDASLPILAWIMCNPSSADEDDPDPTVTRVAGFTRGFGFGGFVVVNIFALVSTDPKGLLDVFDPVGPCNDSELIRVHRDCAKTVVAWGSVGGRFTDRVNTVRAVLDSPGAAPLWCLGKTNAGHPKHPVRLAASTRLEPWP